MIISDSQNNNPSSKMNRNNRKYSYGKRFLFLLMLVIIVVSAYLASTKLKSKGYKGLFDFAITVTSNYWNGLDADPEKISIEIKDKDLKKLEKNRKQALERGVIINDLDGEYVSAVIDYNGKKINVKLRLKGHMTDHLQADKWSFRIKVKEKDETVMGMKRFSIQHPGTRGYIYEWIYHELMKREDIIALRYKFINVSINGKDWGIYAVEENFENELIENNKRIKGPILRFNPDLYWVNRYNEYTRTASMDEYASYYSANPEAYREDKVLQDSTQKLYYLKAIALMEGLRNKKIDINTAFDVPRLAKFHAIIDLVGGVHSIDWSDIKYYYNPVNEKLEPVAYESFTNLSSHDLSCQYKYVQLDSCSNYEDWHSMIFSDKIFFAEYLRQIERVSQPEYLNAFFNEANTELKDNLSIIYKEFPYKKFDAQEYYKRQLIIKKIIDPPKALHAYFNKMDGGNALIQIAGIDALPVEIRSVTINGYTSIQGEKIIVTGKQKNVNLSFKEYNFNFPLNVKFSKNFSDSITIHYSILGSGVIKQAKVFPFPHTDNEFISEELKNREGNVELFSFLMIDKVKKLILIAPGKHVVDKDLILPSGYKIFADQEVSLDIKSKAKIISYSSFIFTGTEDKLLVIESSDSTSEGIEFIDAPESKFSFVVFKNLPEVHDKQWARTGALTFYESAVSFSNCSFYNGKAEDAVNMIRSAFSFKDCLFRKMNNDALDIDFSDGIIENCVFENCLENAVDVNMGNLKLKSVYVEAIGNKALNIKAGAELTGNDVAIKSSFIAISAEDLSMIDLDKVKISDSEIGIVAYKNKSAGGQPRINITGLNMLNVEKKYIKEKKSDIIINGSAVGEVIDNVGTFIKDEKNKKK